MGPPTVDGGSRGCECWGSVGKIKGGEGQLGGFNGRNVSFVHCTHCVLSLLRLDFYCLKFHYGSEPFAQMCRRWLNV